MRLAFPVLATAFLAAACASGERHISGPGAAVSVDPVALQRNAGGVGGERYSYRIGPSDKLTLRVFQVEDLSFEEIVVDASGDLQLPLLGSVRAQGLTPAELSRDLERRLGERFLRDPQVVVTVAEAASQKITIDGSVTKPGVYKMQGRTTLIQAIAMAEGATRIADLRNVAVFREAEGQTMVALFDLGAIRAGAAADPELLGDDIVVVDTSRLSARMQDVLQALPSLASFFYYAAR